LYAGGREFFPNADLPACCAGDLLLPGQLVTPQFPRSFDRAALRVCPGFPSAERSERHSVRQSPQYEPCQGHLPPHALEREGCVMSLKTDAFFMRMGKTSSRKAVTPQTATDHRVWPI